MAVYFATLSITTQDGGVFRLKNYMCLKGTFYAYLIVQIVKVYRGQYCGKVLMEEVGGNSLPLAARDLSLPYCAEQLQYKFYN